jgi:hypothetical protein
MTRAHNFTVARRGGAWEIQTLSLVPGTVICRRQARAAVRCSPPLETRQALPRRLLLPVRPGVGADDSASRAHHPRPECRHRHVIRPRIGAHDRPVVALPARHVERPHAVLAHVAECHRFDGLVDAPGSHPAIVSRAAAVGEGDAERAPDAADHPARPPLQLYARKTMNRGASDCHEKEE